MAGAGGGVGRFFVVGIKGLLTFTWHGRPVMPSRIQVMVYHHDRDPPHFHAQRPGADVGSRFLRQRRQRTDPGTTAVGQRWTSLPSKRRSSPPKRGGAASLGVDPSGGRSRNDLLAVLVDRGQLQIHEMLTAFVTDSLDRRGRLQRVARPHLVGEADAEFR